MDGWVEEEDLREREKERKGNREIEREYICNIVLIIKIDYYLCIYRKVHLIKRYDFSLTTFFTDN